MLSPFQVPSYGAQPSRDQPQRVPPSARQPAAPEPEAPTITALEFPFVYADVIAGHVVSQVSGAAIVVGTDASGGPDAWTIDHLQLDGLNVAAPDLADDEPPPVGRVALPREHVLHTTLLLWLYNGHRHAITAQWAELLRGGAPADEPAELTAPATPAAKTTRPRPTKQRR